MKKLLFLLLASCVLLCIGCTKTSPFEPTGPEDTLLIGKIILYASGYDDVADIKMNGKHENDIEITMGNIKSDETHVLLSKYGGLFYINHLPPGTYGMTKLAYKATGEHGTYTLNMGLKKGIDTALIPIEPGKVTNLGYLIWMANEKTGISFIIQNEEASAALRDGLAAQFPESAWLSREWIDVDFYSSKDPDAIPAVARQ